MKRKRHTSAWRRERAATIVTHAAALSQRIEAVTFPIYQALDNGRPDAWGSAVLLALGEAKFVLTAGHVLDRERDRELRIATGSHLSPLRGERVRLFREGVGGSRDDDIDVVAVRVGGESWDTVAPESFARWDDLDHSPIVPTRDAFALNGYPISKQRGSVKGSTIEARAYQALGRESPWSGYEAEGRDPATSLMVGLTKRLMWSPEGHSTAPDMYGMSGSGLWRFGPDVEDATAAPGLSAIIIQWREKGRHQHILGTRIRPIITALAGRWPDVRAFVAVQLGTVA